MMMITSRKQTCRRTPVRTVTEAVPPQNRYLNPPVPAKTDQEGNKLPLTQTGASKVSMPLFFKSLFSSVLLIILKYPVPYNISDR